jgi:hypothetical protein
MNLLEIRVKRIATGLMAGLFVLAVGAAQAAPVFFDDFETTAQGLNQTSFAKWDVVSGTVDVIGDGGSYPVYPVPGFGNYVDLNGSSGAPGALSTKISFGAGTYSVSFDLAGSQGGVGNVDPSSHTTKILFSIGGETQELLLDPSSPFTTYTFLFTTTDVGKLTFRDLAGGNNNVGNLLDNVSVTAVPEASTWAMMILGFAGVGYMTYRRRKTAAVAA